MVGLNFRHRTSTWTLEMF